MSGLSRTRLGVESLERRETPAAVGPVVENVVEILERPTTLEGQECLVFYLGGVASTDPVSFTRDARSSGL
jgi:hypothetical protein